MAAARPSSGPTAGALKMPRVTVTLPAPLLARLDAAAKREGLSRSAALAQAAGRWCDGPSLSDAGDAFLRTLADPDCPHTITTASGAVYDLRLGRFRCTAPDLG